MHRELGKSIGLRNNLLFLEIKALKSFRIFFFLIKTKQYKANLFLYKVDWNLVLFTIRFFIIENPKNLNLKNFIQIKIEFIYKALPIYNQLRRWKFGCFFKYFVFILFLNKFQIKLNFKTLGCALTYAAYNFSKTKNEKILFLA